MQHEKIIELASVPVLLRALYDHKVVVSESYSEFEKDIIYFAEFKVLENYIVNQLSAGRKFIGIAIFYPETEGLIQKRKIKLNPKKCDGATYRYAVEGWGIIHLQLTNKDAQTISCRLAVNTEKRATAWADTSTEIKSPALWKWQLVEKHARRLIRELKKCA